jgi:hypothetical protein
MTTALSARRGEAGAKDMSRLFMFVAVSALLLLPENGQQYKFNLPSVLASQ